MNTITVSGLFKVLQAYAVEVLLVLFSLFHISFETSGPECFLKKMPVRN